MASKGDTRAAGAVNAIFDQDFKATSQGGAVLIEQVMRALKVRRHLEKLPARSDLAEYSAQDAAYAMLVSKVLNGKGLNSTEVLREDGELARIFGLEGRVPEEATSYNIHREFAGLPKRKMDEAYEASGPSLVGMDMFGHEKKAPSRRRVVPEEPEEADEEKMKAFHRVEDNIFAACLRALCQSVTFMLGFCILFGDGTDLEVRGRCFDAACKNREGKKVLRWLTVMCGPLIAAHKLVAGSVDEGKNITPVLERAMDSVRGVLGAKRRYLGLLDSAFFEKGVVEWLRANKVRFIIGANQMRNPLTCLAVQVGNWTDTGADVSRGWAQSQVSVFTHQPEEWAGRVTIVARRWREEGEMEGMWHYSFVGTDLEPADLPGDHLKKHGYASLIWMMYGTKQGRENHYKTPLRDIALHHPPSGRLGLDEVHYSLGAMASNITMVVRYRVMGRDETDTEAGDNGIQLWRLREKYFQIAGVVTRHGRRILVRLAGGNVDAERQALFQRAMARAASL